MKGPFLDHEFLMKGREAHGGKICGENNADGKGSTFVFTLSSKRNDE
jgi:signal transduction histidine kinase